MNPALLAENDEGFRSHIDYHINWLRQVAGAALSHLEVVQLKMVHSYQSPYVVEGALEVPPLTGSVYERHSSSPAATL
jgi:hypothetical protein